MGNETMTPGLMEEFRQRLTHARRLLIRAVATTDEELATLERHAAGASGDDIASAVAMTLLSRLEGRDRHELDEIATARARLEFGAFGICEGCARPVPLARLRAMPTARLCVSCQSREER